MPGQTLKCGISVEQEGQTTTQKCVHTGGGEVPPEKGQ